jgi:hypothetical protein
VRLSWVLGLRRLGHDAWLFEQVDAAGAEAGAAFFAQVTRHHGLESRAVLLGPAGPIGMDRWSEVEDLAERADLLVNISGDLRDPKLLGRFRRRVYVDLDPGFTQFWHAQGQLGDQLSGYDRYFTVGLNIGGSECSIPTAGIEWIPLPPPVLLEQWEPLPERAFDRFTTVATWRNAFGAPEVAGESFTLKHHELRRFAGLPRRAGIPFEIALDIHSDEGGEAERLCEQGWNLVEPGSVASDPDAFRDYVRHSGAEFSVAQGVYAQTRSGWISDRTAHYLAAGRPAIVQETGIPAAYRADAGMLAFSDMDSAVTAVARVVDSYDEHAAGARRFAERTFDSDRVLARMLEAVSVR